MPNYCQTYKINSDTSILLSSEDYPETSSKYICFFFFLGLFFIWCFLLFLSWPFSSWRSLEHLPTFSTIDMDLGIWHNAVLYLYYFCYYYHYFCYHYNLFSLLSATWLSRIGGLPTSYNMGLEKRKSASNHAWTFW